MFVDLNEAIRKAQEFGGKWRVPSGPELESVIDRSCGSPVVDVVVFPDIQNDEDGEADYWTTSPVGTAQTRTGWDVAYWTDSGWEGWRQPPGSPCVFT